MNHGPVADRESSIQDLVVKAKIITTATATATVYHNHEADDDDDDHHHHYHYHHHDNYYYHNYDYYHDYDDDYDYYNYYDYYKSTDYSDASLKLQGHFTYQIKKKSFKAKTEDIFGWPQGQDQSFMDSKCGCHMQLST